MDAAPSFLCVRTKRKARAKAGYFACGEFVDPIWDLCAHGVLWSKEDRQVGCPTCAARKLNAKRRLHR
jgi:hypothetical protein